MTFVTGDAVRRKLTWAQVRAIRHLAATITHGSLAERARDVHHDLGLSHVSVCAVRQVITGDSFRASFELQFTDPFAEETTDG